ncbi:MAG: hypothetical protein HY928_14690 [Elusimicrobia bacterium]|nr:hypothetical protein [Elusimicrobiota bacterium]
MAPKTARRLWATVAAGMFLASAGRAQGFERALDSAILEVGRQGKALRARAAAQTAMGRPAPAPAPNAFIDELRRRFSQAPVFDPDVPGDRDGLADILRDSEWSCRTFTVLGEELGGAERFRFILFDGIYLADVSSGPASWEHKYSLVLTRSGLSSSGEHGRDWVRVIGLETLIIEHSVPVHLGTPECPGAVADSSRKALGYRVCAVQEKGRP